MNKLEVAKLRAEDILAQYGVSNWGVKVTNSRKTLAVTDHGTKLVELSKRFIQAATIEQFDGIIHHEIAHILAGPGKGHGKEFVQICKQINPDEVYSCDNFPLRIGRFLYTCPNCGVLGSNEKQEDIVCGICINNGDFVPVEVTKNIIVPTVWASTP